MLDGRPTTSSTIADDPHHDAHAGRAAARTGPAARAGERGHRRRHARRVARGPRSRRRLVAVVAQEQLLERRRLARRACARRRRRAARSAASRCGGVDVEARRGRPSTSRPCTPGEAGEPRRRRASVSAVDRRAGQVAQLGERAGLHRAAGADDAHPSHSASTSARMWLDSSTVRPSARDLADARPGTPPPSAGRGPTSARRARAARRRRRARRPARPSGGCPSSRCGPSCVGSSSKRSSSSSRRVRSRSPRSRPSRSIDLAAGELGPQVHVAGHVGEPAVQRDRVAPRVAAEQRRPRPPSAAQQPEQHPDGRGLAGAVRARGTRAPRRAATSRSSPSRAGSCPNVLTRPAICDR